MLVKPAVGIDLVVWLKRGDDGLKTFFVHQRVLDESLMEYTDEWVASTTISLRLGVYISTFFLAIRPNQCGSGTRTPHDARRAHERWVSDYESMLITPEGRRIVAELLVKSMRRLTLQPGTIRDMRLMNEMIEAAARTTLLVRVGKAAKAGQ